MTFRAPSIGERRPLLTPKERRVLLEHAHGLTSTEIGARLYLTQGTVRNFYRSIEERMGARSLIHALTLALISGQVTVSDLVAADKEQVS